MTGGAAGATYLSNMLTDRSEIVVLTIVSALMIAIVAGCEIHRATRTSIHEGGLALATQN